MTISRITTWVDGQILTAGALNNEFDNLISNATALISPLTGDLNFGLHRATNFSLERLSTNPSVVTTGRMFQRVTVGSVMVGQSGFVSTGYYPIGGNGPGCVTGLQGSLISNIGSFAAQGYQLGSPNFGYVGVNATSSFSIDTQAVGPGANSRDQIAAFASTDIHFYAYVNEPGSTQIQGICSSNPPPIGPAVVSFWTYLCSAKYDVAASAMTREAVIRGSHLLYSSQAAFPAGPSILSAGGASVLTSIGGTTVSDLVPTVATHMQIDPVALVGVASTAGQTTVNFYVCSGTSGPLQRIGGIYRNFPGGSVLHNGTELGAQGPALSVPVLTNPPALSYLNLVQTGTSGNMSLVMAGYTVPNGDVG